MMKRALAILFVLLLAVPSSGELVRRWDTLQLISEGDALTYKGVVGWGRYGRAVAAKGTVIHYAGPRDQPAILCTDVGQTYTGLNLWRSEYYPGVPLDVLPDGSIGPRPGSTGFYCLDPCSTLALRDGSINGFNIGLHIGKRHHCESFTIANYFFTSNNTCIQNDEPQAVAHELGPIKIAAGNKIFWHSRVAPGNRVCGGLPSNITSLAVMNPTLLFKVGQTSPNGSTIKIGYIKIDGNAGEVKPSDDDPDGREGWQFCHHDGGPLTIIADGDMGQGATPDKDALKLGPDADISRFRLKWKGAIWPHDYAWSEERNDWVRKTR